MVLRPFITRPLPYNSVVAAFIGPPVISDDLEWVGVLFFWNDAVLKQNYNKQSLGYIYLFIIIIFIIIYLYTDTITSFACAII